VLQVDLVMFRVRHLVHDSELGVNVFSLRSARRSAELDALIAAARPQLCAGSTTVANASELGGDLVGHWALIDGTECYCVEPTAGAARRLDGDIIYLHGDDFGGSDPHCYKDLLGLLAALCGRRVLAPWLPAAPEHPYPHAANLVSDFVAARCEGAGPGNIALVGSGSGASLALSLYRRGALSGAAPPAVLALLCPWLDLTLGSVTTEAIDPVHTVDDLKRAAAVYSGGQSRAFPGLSPLLAETSGWSRLYIQLVRDDILFGDGIRLVNRIKGKPGRLQVDIIEDGFHCMQTQPGCCPEASFAALRLAREIALGFMRKVN